jgi:hypothetical protein
MDDEKQVEFRDLSFENLITMPRAEIQKLLNNISLYDQHRDRDAFREKFGFSIPCKEAFDRIKQSENLIGIGSGTGYWEEMLSIPAYDDKTGQYGFKHREAVTEMGAETAVSANPDSDVFCSWPSYKGEWFTRAVKRMKPGRLLYYIGESRGGCTAADSFFLFKNKKIITCIDIPTWYGLHDRLYIYKITNNKEQENENY